MNISSNSDPVRIGPGIWISMHTEAYVAVTDPLKISFETNVNASCDNFRCKKCQPHFRKFIDSHPFHKYWNITDSKGRDIGFFQWTWELHNEVNEMLGKYKPSLEEAYNYYSDNTIGACFDCGEKNTVNPVNPQEQRSRAIPHILTTYISTKDVKPIPFKLISR